MLDRTTLSVMYFKTVEQLGLENKQVVIEAGGALVALGIRDNTNDLDLSIPLKRFEALRLEGYPISKFDDVEVLHYAEGVDLHIYTGDWTKTFTTFDGIVLPSIDEQIQLKRRLTRSPERSVEKKSADEADIRSLVLFKMVRRVVDADDSTVCSKVNLIKSLVGSRESGAEESGK